MTTDKKFLSIYDDLIKLAKRVKTHVEITMANEEKVSKLEIASKLQDCINEANTKVVLDSNRS